MRQSAWFFAICTLALVLSGCGSKSYEVELLNVSYDPTRELYKDINKAFGPYHEKKTGKRVKATTTHGGSGAQARAVIDGQPADVVTLALAGDIDQIAKSDLLPKDWQKLPRNSCPYTSTIVFVVRSGNPKKVKDWPDLIRDDLEVVTPNPKTSGGARWNFLAAWGYQTVHLGKGETEATEFVRKLYANVKKLDTGARGSSETFARRKEGDVFISWENEAILLKNEAKGEGLEIVYPSISILAEPPVALVDKNVDARGTREVAEAYLQFLYSDEAQEIIGKHGYRPFNEKFDTLPKAATFTLSQVAGDWTQAQAKFFSDGGVFDKIRAK